LKVLSENRLGSNWLVCSQAVPPRFWRPFSHPQPGAVGPGWAVGRQAGWTGWARVARGGKGWLNGWNGWNVADVGFWWSLGGGQGWLCGKTHPRVAGVAGSKSGRVEEWNVPSSSSRSSFFPQVLDRGGVGLRLGPERDGELDLLLCSVRYGVLRTEYRVPTCIYSTT
jgi:hypothetical protein